MDRLTKEQIKAIRSHWNPNRKQFHALCDMALHSLSQEAARDEVLVALEEGYAVLADITNQWEGRHTIAGQKLLCKMRDAIASATGISGEFVQDNATNPLKREPNAAGGASDAEASKEAK